MSQKKYLYLLVTLLSFLFYSCSNVFTNLKSDEVILVDIYDLKTQKRSIKDKTEIHQFIECLSLDQFKKVDVFESFSVDGEIRIVDEKNNNYIMQYDLEKGVRILSDGKWLYYLFTYCFHRYLLEI